MKFYASNIRLAALIATTIAILLEQCQFCHALRRRPQPSCVHFVTPTFLTHFPHSNFIDRKLTFQTRLSSTNDIIYHDEWDDDAASKAILSGQGDLFSLGRLPPRGGGNDIPNNGIKSIATCIISAIHPTHILQSIKNGYAHRIAADPSFLSKSILEIILAATTQYMAEVSRRGKGRILPEFDFVFAGVLTAVCGKYYSMWRVARTVDAHAMLSEIIEHNMNNPSTISTATTNNWRDKVPTNAFQPTLFDGYTPPTLSSRFLAFLLPMPQLFHAGVIASTIGYGLTSILIRLRALIAPHYVVATEPVSVVLAAVYTGLFMAFVSNIRYQMLQGIIEPFLLSVTQALSNRIGSWVNVFGKVAVLLVRYANGVLGSWIAIGGMRAVGLQKLKQA
ncbi:hypothetical protein ACHAXH_004480 [Discostella pseudostelligera]